MDGISCPERGVHGYQSLIWAIHNFIQADHEYESLPSWSDEAIDRYMDVVDAAVFVTELIEGILDQQHTE